jgi:hypothetical protein
MRDLYHGGYTASTVWCFSRGERMIDEYIIEFDDYIGIGAGAVSILHGNFYVDSFSLDRYHEMVSAGRLPIVGWRQLSARENQRYYLLTKLFGMQLEAEAFRRRFGGHQSGQPLPVFPQGAAASPLFQPAGVTAHCRQQRRLQRFPERGLLEAGVGIRDEGARLDVPPGVDVDKAPPGGKAAPEPFSSPGTERNRAGNAHWEAPSMAQGNPVKSQPRVHSIRTHAAGAECRRRRAFP